MHSAQPHTSMNQGSPYFWLWSLSKHGPVPRQSWRWLENQFWKSNKNWQKICSTWKHSTGAKLSSFSVLRAFRKPSFGVGSRHYSSHFPGSFLLFTVTQEPFPQVLLEHKIGRVDKEGEEARIAERLCCWLPVWPHHTTAQFLPIKWLTALSYLPEELGG